MTPPAQRVQFILGEEGRQEHALETHPVFSEMEELFVGEDGDMEWKETARSVQGKKIVLSLKSWLLLIIVIKQGIQLFFHVFSEYFSFF